RGFVRPGLPGSDRPAGAAGTTEAGARARWLSPTGGSQRSRTRRPAASVRVRNLPTRAAGGGILLKSGQSTLLKTLPRSVVITGSMLLIVTAAPTSQKASVSVR